MGAPAPCHSAAGTMAGGWQIVVFYMLPFPLALVALLVAPLPASMKKPTIKLVDWLLDVRLNEIPIVTVAIIVSAVLFVGLCFETAKPSSVPEHLTPNQVLSIRARRWRAERNFWISALVLLLWLMLYRVR